MQGRSEILFSIFRRGEAGYLQSGQSLIEADKVSRYVYRLRTGLAYQSHGLHDGRRAIVDILAPGNVAGLETIVSARASGTVTAAGPVTYLALEANSLRESMEDRRVALSLISLLIESRRRSEELSARIARLEAPERVAAMLIELYDRLRNPRLIARDTYNLHLTQQQIGDYLGLTGVHVNRVLRWLAREDIAFVKGYVVIIRDMPRLRRLARGEEPIETRRARPTGDRLAERV